MRVGEEEEEEEEGMIRREGQGVISTTLLISSSNLSPPSFHSIHSSFLPSFFPFWFLSSSPLPSFLPYIIYTSPYISPPPSLSLMSNTAAATVRREGGREWEERREGEGGYMVGDSSLLPHPYIQYVIDLCNASPFFPLDIRVGLPCM